MQFRPKEPICALVPKSQECQLNDHWCGMILAAKEQITHDVFVFSFRWPDTSSPLNLATCSCLIATLNPSPFLDPENVTIRAYTPVSTNVDIGFFQLMIKIYPKGKLTQQLSKVPEGGIVHFKQVKLNIKIPYMPKVGFQVNGNTITKFGMIVGGTGITPMIQVLNALLGDNDRVDKDDIRIHLLFGNKTQKDMLAKEILDEWMTLEHVSSRLTITHVLSNEPPRSNWKGERGHINAELIGDAQTYMFPGPSENCLIFVCGPLPMYNSVSGPRTEKTKLSGALYDLGYKPYQVYKF